MVPSIRNIPVFGRMKVCVTAFEATLAGGAEACSNRCRKDGCESLKGEVAHG